jgi:hypothetical protein
MSKLRRKEFDKKWNMPEYMVLGTVNQDTANKVNDMVLTGNKDNVKDIITSINLIIGTDITNVSADIWEQAFRSEFVNTNEYVNPTGIFFLCTKGSARLDVDVKSYNMDTNKLYFVNERCKHRIVQDKNRALIMLTASFLWNPEIHGE